MLPKGCDDQIDGIIQGMHSFDRDNTSGSQGRAILVAITAILWLAQRAVQRRFMHTEGRESSVHVYLRMWVESLIGNFEYKKVAASRTVCKSVLALLHIQMM